MKGNDMLVKVDQTHISLKIKVFTEGHDQSFC